METTANLLSHRLQRLIAENADREQIGEAIRRVLELERAAHASAAAGEPELRLVK